MSTEMNASPLKSGDLSPPDCASDPDEKEISDEDDDRNHKHRRRDTRSQSIERDPLEQSSTQPFRKRNRTIQNGQSDPQSHHNLNRDFSKRRLNGTNVSRFSGPHGSGRGRGRDFQWDSRFGSFDGASQMAHPGSIPPAMFTGRGLPVSHAQNASWGGFGLMPTMPNGGIDAINPLGMPGILGPQMNPPMNMGIQRQRCRDFEERGFCLRGDMCPMEHGVNRIVVEDVQSLSHFNLPVSLPNAQMSGTSAGSGFGPSAGGSSTLINSRGPHSSGADVYDPDQPLWNNDAPETSNPLLGLQSSNFDETVSFMDADLSDHLVQSGGDGVGNQNANSSVWGRLRNSKNKTTLKERFDVTTKASETKDVHESSGGTQGKSHVGYQTEGAHSGAKPAVSTSNLYNNSGGTARKPSQKAQRTLFVNCIPLKDNKRENLLSHFRKFGEVVDLYIPANSERAFVQFSKREEAEKALKAPDAVMGSRFIKLWWANRDNIADNGVSSAPHMSNINEGQVNVMQAAPKVAVPKPCNSIVASGKDFKPLALNSPKSGLPSPKKMENLELLKELRKKQEMLERKRNEFRQQLDKLTKQGSSNSEVLVAPSEKRQTSETLSNPSKAGKTQPLDVGISMSSVQAEMSVDKKVIENLALQRAAKAAGALQDPAISKQPIHPMANSRGPPHMNRYNSYKLDNRPTTFKIIAPLPGRLTNVDVLRDHFSSYGEIPDVKIEFSAEEQNRDDLSDSEAMRNCSARVSFATRHTAERAFLKSKIWHGHSLQFSWVTSSKPTSSQSSGESCPPLLKETVNTEVQSTEETVGNNVENTFDPEDNNSSPPKSSNELSPAEKHSLTEAQSPIKEPDESENEDSEKQEAESTGDDQKLDEDVRDGRLAG